MPLNPKQQWQDAWRLARQRLYPEQGLAREHVCTANWLLAARDGPAGAWAFPVQQRLASWQARKANAQP